LISMLAALGLVLALSWRDGALGRRSGAVLIALYLVFVAAIWLRTS